MVGKVRPIPPWVYARDDEEVDVPSLSVPSGAEIAESGRHKPRGTLSDEQYSQNTSQPTNSDTQAISRWKAFVEASAPPRISPHGGRILPDGYLNEHFGDYSRPWLAGRTAEEGDLEAVKYHARRRAWWERAQRTILRSAIVPLIIRMNVWVYSAVALGLAVKLHDNGDVKASASPDMAIIVDAVAMAYLIYIMWDEYSGKPLGLRATKAKMRLIFLDLFFIVFDSANLSIAFQATRDCGDGVRDDCGRQKALASVLLIALVAWLLTFAISVMRLIERVTGRQG